jgi:hypothetical protein
VHLPQVHVADAQTRQRRVERAEQVAARDVVPSSVLAGADPGLGGEHDLVAGDDVAEEAAEELLGGTVAVAGGGVDEGPAGVGERDQLVAGLVLVRVPAPRHGSQTQPGHLESGRADRPLLHGDNVAKRP